jgi:hypothetical protein
VFSYFIGAIASVLVDFDSKQKPDPETDEDVGLTERELAALRSILEKNENR